MKYTYQTDGPRGPPAFYWRKNMKHILSCSFGKDSIATALLALQHGEPLDELVYCEVMFSEEISGELPEHNRFIHETAIPYFEQRGIPTRVLRSEKTYLSCFYHVVTRGKTKGMLSGFPLSGRCTIQRDCKLPPIKAYEPLALDGAYANFNFYNHLVRHLGEDAIAELGKNGGWADNEAAVTAAQEIIDFVNAGYLAEGAPDAYPASQTKVGLGTAAMVVCANYVTSEVDAAVGEPVNWGFFNYPEVEGNVDASAYAGANSLAISSNCENPQAAFDFIMTIVTGTCGQELVDNGGQIPADTRLKESVLAGSVETLKNTTTPMSWCGSLNTLDGWSSIKSSMIELFEGKYATGADYCAYLDTLCG